MRIGIFGGSFNPPHLGHLNSLQTVAKKAGLDIVRVIPAAQNPLKVQIEGATAEQRLEMTKLALNGWGEQFVVDDQEIREAIEEVVASIVNAVRIALERTPPELSADIIDRGIILTGGGALLKNLDKRLREETQLPVFLTEDPLTSVVMGAGKLLDDLDLLRKISLE